MRGGPGRQQGFAILLRWAIKGAENCGFLTPNGQEEATRIKENAGGDDSGCGKND
jgi:hypothetical protein